MLPRRPISRLLFCAWIVATGIWCLKSDFGRRGVTELTVDWAHHLTLVEAYAIEGYRQVDRPNLGEMDIYPPLTHWICGRLARALSINPILTAHTIVAASLFAVMAIIALLFGQVLEEYRPSSRWLAIFWGVASCGAVTFVGLGPRSTIAYHFFYPQIVALSLAFGAFLPIFLATTRSFSTMRAAVVGLFAVLAMWILFYAHLSAALWFCCAAALRIAFWAPSWRKRILWLGLLGSISLTITVFHPGFRAMVEISGNNGGLACAFGTINNPLGYGIVATLLGILGVQVIWQQFGLKNLAAYLYTHAGLLAAGAVTSGVWVVFLLNGSGSPYAIKKQIVLLLAMTPLIPLGFFARSPNGESQPKFGATDHPWQVALVALAIFIAQWPFLPTVHDISGAVAWREKLLPARYSQRLIANPRYPSLLSNVFENYYLAVAVLGYPRDDQMYAWLEKKDANIKLLDYTNDILLPSETLAFVTKLYTAGLAKPASTVARYIAEVLPEPEGFLTEVSDIRNAHPIKHCRVDLGTDTASASLGAGWSGNETSGNRTVVWSDGPESVIYCRMSPDDTQDYFLILEAEAKNVHTQIFVNDTLAGSVFVTGYFKRHRLRLDPGILRHGENVIRFIYDHTETPAINDPNNQDQRQLAIFTDRVEVEELPRLE